MGIEKDIKKLQSKHDENGILTVYLNTDISEQDADEWKIRLKNGFSDLEKYAKSIEGDESKALKQILEDAERAIYDAQTDMKKGLVLVASADGELWEEKFLQVPVETEMHWEKQAVTQQLEELKLRYPPMGIIVAQQMDVLFIEAALGEIRDEIKFSWDFGSEDWVDYHKDSPAFATDTADDKFQQRFEENRYRWYKSLVPKLAKQIKKRSVEGAYIIGSKEVAGDLEDNMDSTHVRGTITKNLGNTPSHEILNEVYDAELR